MSRSYHATLAERRRTARRRDLEREERSRRLDELREGIRTKRRVKSAVKEDRRADDRSAPPVDTDAIRIEVEDRGPFVLHPAAPEDLRELMRRLPAGALNGIAEIRLELGLARMDEELDEEDREDAERDPWLRRAAFQALPGVWMAEILGSFFREAKRIVIYAAVRHPALPQRRLAETLLRLRALATFLHEVAHHDDHRRRRARGRWRMDLPGRDEHRAEAQAGAWAQEFLVPLAEERWAADLEELQGWLERHGGARVSTLRLAGDWRPDERGRLQPVLVSTMTTAIGELARDVHRGRNAIETKLRFAHELESAESFEDVVAVCDGVLRESPDHAEALHQRASGRWWLARDGGPPLAAAERDVRRAIELEPANLSHRLLLVRVLEAGRQWEELVAAGTDALRLAREQDPFYLHMLLPYYISGALGAGRDALAADAAEQLLKHGSSYTLPLVLFVRALLALRSGRFAEALDLAGSLDADKYLIYQLRLKGVRCAARAALGRPPVEERLSAYERSHLRLNDPYAPELVPDRKA